MLCIINSSVSGYDSPITIRTITATDIDYIEEKARKVVDEISKTKGSEMSSEEKKKYVGLYINDPSAFKFERGERALILSIVQMTIDLVTTKGYNFINTMPTASTETAKATPATTSCDADASADVKSMLKARLRKRINEKISSFKSKSTIADAGLFYDKFSKCTIDVTGIHAPSSVPQKALATGKITCYCCKIFAVNFYKVFKPEQGAENMKLDVGSNGHWKICNFAKHVLWHEKKGKLKKSSSKPQIT